MNELATCSSCKSLAAQIMVLNAEVARLKLQLESSPWLTAEEAAARAKVPVTVINRARRDRQIRFDQKMGPGGTKVYRFHRDAVDEWGLQTELPTVERPPAEPSRAVTTQALRERHDQLVRAFVAARTQRMGSWSKASDLLRIYREEYLRDVPAVDWKDVMTDKQFFSAMVRNFESRELHNVRMYPLTVVHPVRAASATGEAGRGANEGAGARVSGPTCEGEANRR